MIKDFFRFMGWALVFTATAVVWLQWMAGEFNQCGEGMATFAQMGRGVMCVQAHKWQR